MAWELQDLWRVWLIVGPKFDAIHLQVTEWMSFAGDNFLAEL
jgi:hypothetical protein